MNRLVGIRVVPDEKISRYLLQPKHTVGGAKARFFIAHGFDQQQPHLLAEALLVHANTYDVATERLGQDGVSRGIIGELATPDGRNPVVLAIWYQARGEALHRLVTAYPA